MKQIYFLSSRVYSCFHPSIIPTVLGSYIKIMKLTWLYAIIKCSYEVIIHVSPTIVLLGAWGQAWLYLNLDIKITKMEAVWSVVVSITEVDLDFSEGSATLLCAKHAWKICNHAHFRLNHAYFRSFLREISCSTCQSIRSWSTFLLRYAKVSHKSSFLRFQPKGGFGRNP